MRKFFGPMGTVSRMASESQALKSNMLGDPSMRVVDVYVPAGHDGQGLPLLVDFVGFTSSGLSETNWVGFHENLPERLDRLIGEQRMPPVVVALPDCFTRIGGNQYINSASVGAWEGFLLHEMLPAIEQRFGCGGLGNRGVFGKSSGGYGAITHALRHSDIWAAARVIPAIWALSSVICRTCPRSCARSPAPRTPLNAGGSSLKPPKNIRRGPAR
jgi:enterochelin esterase-like enzyme